MIEKLILICDKFANMRLESRIGIAVTTAALAIFGVLMFTPAYCNGQKGPVIVTEEGITITKCDVDPKRVEIEWTTTDKRIIIGQSIFKVQGRKLRSVRDGMIVESYNPQWKDLVETTGTNVVHEGFTVGETWEYRIAVDITELIEPQDE